MPTPAERFEALFNTRNFTVDLPIGLERRLQAHAHRINTALLLDGYGDELLNIHEDLDLGIVLLTVAEYALDHAEDEIGIRYDMATGKPRANLEELPQGS